MTHVAVSPHPARLRDAVVSAVPVGRAVAAVLLALILVARPLYAQHGTGSTGAQVLQLPAGGRAATLSGAYTAASTDADVLFYNPAGIGALTAAAGFSYERWSQPGIAFMTGSGAYRIGPVVVGAAGAFLDAGTIEIIVPDPAFGGERGMSTGETASAGQSAIRFGAAMPVMIPRFRLGVAAGFVSTGINAGSRGDFSRSAAVFDAGLQYNLDFATLGVSLRNLGGDLSGDGAAATSLPTDVRIGILSRYVTTAGIGAVVSADFISRLAEDTNDFVAGLEAGLLPTPDRQYSAVARAGFGAGGNASISPLRFGIGFSVRRIAVDYMYRQTDFFGSMHRIGVRWSLGPDR